MTWCQKGTRGWKNSCGDSNIEERQPLYMVATGGLDIKQGLPQASYIGAPSLTHSKRRLYSRDSSYLYAKNLIIQYTFRPLLAEGAFISRSSVFSYRIRLVTWSPVSAPWRPPLGRWVIERERRPPSQAKARQILRAQSLRLLTQQ